MPIYLAKAFAVLHIILLSRFQDTQLTVILACCRLSALSIAKFSTKLKIRKACALSLLASQVLNIAIVGYLYIFPEHSNLLSSPEWAMLVFDLLVLLITLQVTHSVAEMELIQMKESLTASLQVQNFLLTESDFHHQN